MGNVLIDIFEIIYLVIGAVGVAIIVWGGLLTLFRIIKLEFSRLKHKTVYRKRELVRYLFASYLILSLEFFIAADIIKTVIHPSFEEIAILASIVAIRTVISYFLEKEIERFNSIDKIIELQKKVSLDFLKKSLSQ